MRQKLTAEEKLMPVQLKGGPGSGRHAGTTGLSGRTIPGTVETGRAQDASDHAMRRNTREAHTEARDAHQIAEIHHEGLAEKHPPESALHEHHQRSADYHRAMRLSHENSRGRATH